MTFDSEFTAACSPWFTAGRELGYVTADPNSRQQRESNLLLLSLQLYNKLTMNSHDV